MLSKHMKHNVIPMVSSSAYGSNIYIHQPIMKYQSVCHTMKKELALLAYLCSEASISRFSPLYGCCSLLVIMFLLSTVSPKWVLSAASLARRDSVKYKKLQPP